MADTTPIRRKLAAWRDLLAARARSGAASHIRAALWRQGMPVLDGVEPLAVEGDGHVEACVFATAQGRERRFPCDAVALGYGIKPETQLAELAGASFRL